MLRFKSNIKTLVHGSNVLSVLYCITTSDWPVVVFLCVLPDQFFDRAIHYFELYNVVFQGN